MAFIDYQINFKKLITDLLDTDRRTEDRIAWLNALLAGVEQLYNDFIEYSNVKKLELSYSPGYKIQIEKLLNDTYGGGITITNNQQTVEANYMFSRSNLQNLGLYNRGDVQNAYLPSRGEYQVNFVNFIVNVPSNLVFNEDQMRALINKYKRLGLTYNIVTY